MATKPTQDTSWTEPPSGYDAHSSLTQVLQTESGHVQIFDDTPDHEIIRTQHRTGTFTEMQPDGSEIHKIMGNNYEIVAQDNNVLIKGVCNITVEGDSILHVKGDAYAQIDGDSKSFVKGKTSVNSADTVDVTSGADINLFAGGATGAVTIRAAEAVNINSDLNVSGSIISKQSMSAVQNVSAGMKLGSTLGVETLGPITSAISVWAPIVSDLRGPMEVIRQEYNFHRHIAPSSGGWTTTPFPLM